MLEDLGQRGRFPGSQATVHCLVVLVLLSICMIETEEPAGDSHIQQGEWHIYVVDEGFPGTIDIDSSSLPYISYRTISDRVLKYATWKHGLWSYKVVDSRSGAGHTSALALNSHDRPTIAHWNSSPHPDKGSLKRAFWDGNDWIFEVVDNGTYAHLSLALDSDDKPHISYFKWPRPEGRDLWFAALNVSGEWDLEIVDSQGDLRYTSLCIDSENHYHTSYEDLEANDLRYAYWDGSTWSVERIDTDGDVGSWSSIKVDASGNPHIAYHDYTNQMLKYASRVMGTWQTTLIDYESAPGPSLDLDSFMRPHISYHGGDWYLRHTWWDGSSWRTEVVDNGSVSSDSSIRIDENNNVHISYLDIENNLVKYATTRPLPTGEIQTTLDIDPDTLNLKSKGKFITAYIELEGADVRDINASSVLLNDALSPVLDTKYGFVTSEDSYIVDNDKDGIMERMVKFDRSEVQKLLAPSEQVILTITGSLYNGTGFEGSDTIRVFDPG